MRNVTRKKKSCCGGNSNELRIPQIEWLKVGVTVVVSKDSPRTMSPGVHVPV